jgi:glycosyltransferase involved in cell wall biosynthesis
VISCVLPTYNRFPESKVLVEEAVESFLRQTYRDKELIIVNDCPAQELHLEYPNVIVLNTPCRFATLGEKLNAGFGMAQGEYLCRFDDDDISLSHRLHSSIDRMQEMELDYWSPKQYFFHSKEGGRVSRNAAPSKSVWTRKIFDAVGGFPHVNSGQDIDYQNLCLHHSPETFDIEEVEPKGISYIYRWGTGSLHLSGYGRGKGGYKKIGEAPTQAGLWELRPHFTKDWETLSQEWHEPSSN